MAKVNHQQLVQRLLDAKAVDFAAIGKVVGELGPSLALAEDDGDRFCGTMKHCIWVCVVSPVPTPVPTPVAE